mgnify:CR=1 FL=1
MEFKTLIKLKDEIKVSFIVTIGEKVFSKINENDERYLDGREALDKCWKWAENKSISADDLYELIDNAECTGISEFAEDEENLNIARLWSLIVDIVSYTAWMGYKKENTKYLPQALESIREDSIIILIKSAVETNFITENEVLIMQQQLLSNYKLDEDMVISKEDFINKVMIK